MTECRFGAIKKVSPRNIWPNEQYDFTPWLAQEDNIGKLAVALGLELEVESVEAAVGPYSADILARDVGSGKYIVIENQFGRTNHDHLGKLITYGAFLDAGAVVWLTESFTEEHHKALDWLNDKSTQDLSFYGVELELWEIEESRPAIRFNVVSRPNIMARQATVVKDAGPLSDTKKLQLEFWMALRDRLLERGVVSSAQTPRPQYWYNVPLGRTHFKLSNIVNTYDGRIGVRVYLRNQVADAALQELQDQGEEIEREMGESLSWNPNPDNQDKIIALFKDVDLSDRDRWPEYCDWLTERIARFRKVFGPRIKNLTLDNPSPDGEEDTDTDV